MTNISSFKRKKQDFDSKIDYLNRCTKTTDKFHAAIKDLSRLENEKKNKLTEILTFLDTFYEEQNPYSQSINNLKFTIARDIQATEDKAQFYKSLPKFNLNVREEINPSIVS